jgi:hypothetical protein
MALSTDEEKSPTALSPHEAFTTAERAEEQPASKEVSWDGDHDKLNPMNWTPRKKWLILAIVSTMTFITCVTTTLVRVQSSE